MTLFFNATKDSTHSTAISKPNILKLSNARLVLDDIIMRGSLVINDGIIEEVQEGTEVARDSIDCEGDYILPGLVELHTDNLERHMEPRPDVNWPHQMAILAHDAELTSTGITTVFDALRVGSLIDSQAKYGAYARELANELIAMRALDSLKISHFLHLRAETCSETLLEEMAQFGPEDHVGIVSIMDHTPGQRQFRDLSALKVYLTKKRSFTDEQFKEHVAYLETLQTQYQAKHEKGATDHAKRYGAVIASHDDTTRDQVLTSKQMGVSFAEFPTTVEAAAACRECGIQIMMGAPNIIRNGSHSGNVSALQLASEDLLDIISSDYVPAALLQAAFKLSDHWEDLPKAVKCVTANPAKAAGLTDRGRLYPGLRGDVVRVNLLGKTPILRGVWSRGLRVG